MDNIDNPAAIKTVSTPGIVDKTERFQLQTVGTAKSNRDEPQWMLEGTVPWSEYPARFYILQTEVPAGGPPVEGSYICSFRRGALTAGKNYDGTRDFMWRWRMLQFNIDPTQASLDNNGAVAPSSYTPASTVASGTAPSHSTPQNSPRPFPTIPLLSAPMDHPRKTESFERGRAAELAISLLIAGKIERSELFAVADALYQFQADPSALMAADEPSTVSDEPILEVEEEEEE